MSYYPITKEKIRENLKARITEHEAELAALKKVKINTKHATLTNRALSGGGRIGDYLSIGKALYVAYAIKYDDGRTRYESRDITAYSYTDLDGMEIGSSGGLRISRTITPSELNDRLVDVKEHIAEAIAGLKLEYRRADMIAKKHNKLVEQINAFNDGLSYASEAKIS